tara:strand:- start:2457 stop:5063 length:2607 start_codon:yes stop_codon:yes gene_type:complete
MVKFPLSGALNDIEYSYGSRGDGINGAGRVTQIIQGTSSAPVLVEKMNYDDLGNVSVHTREIDIPNVGVQAFTSKTQFDSWGRILKMTYPDGEQLRYFHSYGGDLFRINSYDVGNSTLTSPSEEYVKQLGYDHYGNRTYMAYGNGTVTSFDYNPNTLRLNQVVAMTSSMNALGTSQTMISKTFVYSGAGNINDINNVASNLNYPYNNLGGGYRNIYNYDGMNRLTNATGNWSGATGPEAYSVTMYYDNMGGIIRKDQSASLNYPGYPGEKYNYYYTQGNTAHPHATSKIWDRRNSKQYTYGYDNNGNPTTTHEQYAPPKLGQPNPSGPITLIQQNYWDEQNQLRGLWNLAGLHHYIYDGDGQRLMKSSVPMSYTSVNAQQLQATNSIPAQDYTVYVNAGLVYESNGGSTTYTKHYYAGPLRVASQIGTGNPNYERHPVAGQIANGGPVNISPKSNGVAVLGDLNALLANYNMSVNANDFPQDTISMQVINDPDECGIFYGDDVIEENRCLCNNFPDLAIQQGIDCGPFAPIYWYHPDYIGNVEFVTDRTGQPYQHFYYAAFGDPLVSQHVGTGNFNSAFRFNAKEYDEETGNYYYGARYYEPKSSVWMGVDAMATSYPGMNPYNFTIGNPIMAIDPDGDSTVVKKHLDVNGNWTGEYKVTGGSINDNNGIYLQDEENCLTLIGYSATPYSFYNSEQEVWMGLINPRDVTGENFLGSLSGSNLNEAEYSIRAYGYQQFDFKRTNGTSETIYDDAADFYRGMPILGKYNGLQVYGSARDVGNIAAGTVFGKAGNSWALTRNLFDLLQSVQEGKFSTELPSTVYAQSLGWQFGYTMRMSSLREQSAIKSLIPEIDVKYGIIDINHQIRNIK